MPPSPHREVGFIVGTAMMSGAIQVLWHVFTGVGALLGFISTLFLIYDRLLRYRPVASIKAVRDKATLPAQAGAVEPLHAQTTPPAFSVAMINVKDEEGCRPARRRQSAAVKSVKGRERVASLRGRATTSGFVSVGGSLGGKWYPYHSLTSGQLPSFIGRKASSAAATGTMAVYWRVRVDTNKNTKV